MMKSNVNAGDFARVVEPVHGAHGQMVYVEQEVPPELRAWLIWVADEWAHVGKIWVCRVFGSVMGFDLDGKPGRVYPGEQAVLGDRYLLRIDPPADSDDVIRTIDQKVTA